jgi:alkyl sulfatase BDS1-like metallo-beta-lactamase superfamily hydrolase
VLPDGEAGDIPIVAPEHFVEHALSENIYAGTAMTRRATYMYGALLPKGPEGQVTAGLGPTTSVGTVGLVPPTIDITRTGEELVLDGVRIVFQMTPGTEAPAEMNFHFPDLRLLCMAENASHNLHNVVTLRGAQVRDARAWSRFLDESLELFGAGTDVMFASHHWPSWGADRVTEFLSNQRDLYGYLHDQTLRLLNKGLTGPEIAEEIHLPHGLDQDWGCRGYYGSVSHNVKAVYQRYMGWFDGNPANLWRLPPEPAAQRYVEFMGGADAVLAKARASYDEGDYRWVAEVVNHVVFAEPTNTEARDLLALTYEQLGYGAENATWRNFYLMGAQELRGDEVRTAVGADSLDMVTQLTIPQILDAVAVRIDGPRADSHPMVLNLTNTDDGERYVARLRNGVLTHLAGRHDDAAVATLAIGRIDLLQLLVGLVQLPDLIEGGRATVEGDVAALATLRSLLDSPDPNFAIVTP